MRKIIKQEINTVAPTKIQAKNNLREHLLMLLQAMQYKYTTKHLDNGQLRELVEKEKIIFLRKLQAEHDRPKQA